MKIQKCNSPTCAHRHTQTFIEESCYDTAQQETHIPGLPTVEAALRLKAVEERKRPLSHHTSGLIIYGDETVETQHYLYVS